MTQRQQTPQVQDKKRKEQSVFMAFVAKVSTIVIPAAAVITIIILSEYNPFPEKQTAFGRAEDLQQFFDTKLPTPDRASAQPLVPNTTKVEALLSNMALPAAENEVDKHRLAFSTAFFAEQGQSSVNTMQREANKLLEMAYEENSPHQQVAIGAIQDLVTALETSARMDPTNVAANAWVSKCYTGLTMLNHDSLKVRNVYGTTMSVQELADMMLLDILAHQTLPAIPTPSPIPVVDEEGPLVATPAPDIEEAIAAPTAAVAEAPGVTNSTTMQNPGYRFDKYEVEQARANREQLQEVVAAAPGQASKIGLTFSLTPIYWNARLLYQNIAGMEADIPNYNNSWYVLEYYAWENQKIEVWPFTFTVYTVILGQQPDTLSEAYLHTSDILGYVINQTMHNGLNYGKDPRPEREDYWFKFELMSMSDPGFTPGGKMDFLWAIDLMKDAVNNLQLFGTN